MPDNDHDEYDDSDFDWDAYQVPDDPSAAGHTAPPAVEEAARPAATAAGDGGALVAAPAAASTRRPIWSAADFSAIAPGSGAKKLVDSQVAPLVAQARGYYSVSTDAEVKGVVDSAYVPEPRKVTNRLKLMVRAGQDFMVIPWYRVDRVVSEGSAVVSGSLQVRPQTPLVNAEGKPAKYEMLAGSTSVLDIHPGTPKEWLEKTTRFMVTEGAIKGDSALTAQLLAAGVHLTDLAANPALGTDGARDRLKELLLPIPKNKRIPVLALVGVGNWHQNPEWNSMSFRDRDILLAFDGDARKNQNVWDQADKLYKFFEHKDGVAKFVDLGGPDAMQRVADAGLDSDFKLGIDDFLAKLGDWSDLLSLVADSLPPRAQRVGRPRIPIEVKVATPDEERIALLAAGPSDAMLIPVFRADDSTGLYVVIDPDGYQHGVVKVAKVNLPEGKGTYLAPEWITNWVPWRPTATTRFQVRPDARLEEFGEVLFTLEFIDQYRRRRQIADLTAKQTLDLRVMASRANLGLYFPGGPAILDALRNVMDNIGVDTAQQKLDRYMQTGWVYPNGRDGISFLGALGSLDADGPVPDLRAEAPAGSGASALGEGAAKIGWPVIAQGGEIVAAAESIPAALGVFKKRSICIAMLGANFAAPLALTTRTLVWLFGGQDFGKSKGASVGFSFQSSVEPGTKFTTTFGGTTRVGAEIYAYWSRHVACYIDDYKMSGDPKHDENMRAAANIVAMKIYGADGGARGTQEGGLRTSLSAETTGVVLAEKLPPATALNRTVPIAVEKGDVLLSPKGTAPWDDWMAQFGYTGVARTLHGAYLQYLAKIINTVGFDVFRHQNIALHRRLVTDIEGRRGETVAVLAAGWAMFRSFAEQAGFAHLLPTEEELNACWAELASESESATEDTDFASQVLNVLADSIAAGEGHVQTAHHGTPLRHPELYGFRDAGHSEWRPAGITTIGTLSLDGTQVVIPREVVQRTAARIGLPRLAPKDLDSAMRKVAAVDPTQKMAPRGQFPNRERGIVVLAELLGLPAMQMVSGATTSTEADDFDIF